MPKPKPEEDSRPHFANTLGRVVMDVMGRPEQPIGMILIIQNDNGSHSCIRHVHEGTNMLSLIGVLEMEKEKAMDLISGDYS